MWKSDPIPMIQNGRQLSSIDMSMCYSYDSSGRHVKEIELPGDVVGSIIAVYGIGLNGSSNLLGEYTLTTFSSYVSNDYASSVCRGIKIKEYPFICWTLDSSMSDRIKILSDGIMIMESKEYSENPSETNTHVKFIIN